MPLPVKAPTIPKVKFATINNQSGEDQKFSKARKIPRRFRPLLDGTRRSRSAWSRKPTWQLRAESCLYLPLGSQANSGFRFSRAALSVRVGYSQASTIMRHVTLSKVDWPEASPTDKAARLNRTRNSLETRVEGRDMTLREAARLVFWTRRTDYDVYHLGVVGSVVGISLPLRTSGPLRIGCLW